MDKNVRAAEDPWTAVVNTGRHGEDERWRQAPRGRERDEPCVRRCRFLRADRTGAVSSLGLLSPPRPVPSRPMHLSHLCVAAGVVSPDSMPQQTRKPQATSSTCTSINALRTEAAVWGQGSKFNPGHVQCSDAFSID